MADHARREPWASSLGWCRHRQEFPCRVHCKRSDGTGGACAYDELCPNPERIERQLFRSGRNDIVDKLCRYPLLIIDDFSMERGTEYVLEQIYNIVDSRYRSRKPLIITTNLTLDEIRHPQDTAHARIYDRLSEMCIPVSCFGVSLRKENAQEKMKRLKSLIS